MTSFVPRAFFQSQIAQFIALVLVIILCTTLLDSQQPQSPPARPAAARETPKAAPSFDNLLAVDSYEVYGELRNVGQLLSTGGAGEIADPIMKLAEPPKEFQSIIKFLKTNSEALATARWLFATSPARTEIPETLVAIEFPSSEEAEKFAPKLEKFLPVILPPVPDATPTPEASETKPNDPAQTRTADHPPRISNSNDSKAPATPTATPEATAGATPAPVAEHLPFVITHAGNRVCIS